MRHAKTRHSSGITLRLQASKSQDTAAEYGAVSCGNRRDTSHWYQLVAEKQLDILLLQDVLLLQESYVRKQGESHTFYGLGTGKLLQCAQNARGRWRLAISDCRWYLFRSLALTVCVVYVRKCKPLAYQYTSCYFQRRNWGPPQAPRKSVSFFKGRENHNGGRY